MAKWRDATSLVDAQTAAEKARNLVVGSHGPGYGDANKDGMIGGAAETGLLPGLHGEPGLAQGGSPSKCVTAEVLGGSWADPTARWMQAMTAVAEWTPNNNTFPALMSHPQRIFGWSSLTLATTSHEDAKEYAGHAQLHVDVTRTAIQLCS